MGIPNKQLRLLLHDLANPLTLAQLNLDNLNSNLRQIKKSEIKKCVESALAGVADASEMLHSLRRQAKSDSLGKYSLAEELDNLVRMFETQLNQERICLLLRCCGDFQLKGHKLELRRAVNNLIVNAIEELRVAPCGVKVLQIAIFKNTQGKIIMISDNGRGIRPERWDLIFKNGYSSKGKTRGEGLYVVQQYVERYFQGRVECQSEPGRGTSFKLIFPF